MDSFLSRLAGLFNNDIVKPVQNVGGSILHSISTPVNGQQLHIGNTQPIQLPTTQRVVDAVKNFSPAAAMYSAIPGYQNFNRFVLRPLHIQPPTIGQVGQNLQKQAAELSSELANPSKALRNPVSSKAMFNMVAGTIGGGEMDKPFTEEQVNMVKNGFTKEVRDLVGKFAEKVESSKNPNQMNLGPLGDYVHSLGETVFGKQAANLTNTQLKNAFDAIQKQAAGKLAKGISIGLSTNDIRGGESSPKPVQSELPQEQQLSSLEQSQPTRQGTFAKGIKGASSDTSLPQNLTKGEAKRVAANIGVQGSKPTIPTGEKNLGVVDTINQSNQTSGGLKGIQGAYDVAHNKETLAAAQKRIATDPQGAYQFAASNHNAEANATAVLLAKQYEAAGQPEMAANLMITKAQQALEAGQGNQIYSVWDKLSPETVGQLAAKTIEKYNATARNKIPGLTAEQYQGFVDKAKALQSLPEGRDKNIATQKLLESIGRLIPTSNVDKGLALWKAGLLTGFRTPGKVIVSHAVTSAAEQAKNLPAALVDKATSLFTGKRSLTPTLRGNLSGFKKGILAGVDNLIHGYNDPETGGITKDFTNQVNFGNSLFGKVAQKYVDSISRLHGSLYKPFYGAAHLNSLYDQALTEAANQHLGGPAREKFIQNFVLHPSAEAADIAKKEAEYATFQNKTLLGQAASGAVQRGGPVAKLVAPFTQIPSSIAMKLVDYSPVGAVKTIIQGIANKGEFDQRAFSQGLGRSITGTGVMAIGAALYNKGMMTLGYPSSQSERAIWTTQGKRENSVLINGKWRSLASLGPVGDALAVGGNFAAGMQGNPKTAGGIGNAAITAGSAGLSTISNAPYLQGINSLTTTLQNPQRSGTTFAKNLSGSIVPTAMANIATATDPYSRETNGITDSITNKIPGLRELNQPQLDIFGKPVPRPNGVAGTLLDPFYSSTNRPTDVTNELQRLQDNGNAVALSPLSKTHTINGQKITLTPQQLSSANKVYGPQILQGIRQVMSDPNYGSMSDAQKSKLLSDAVRNVRSNTQVITNAVQGKSQGASTTSSSPITGNNLTFYDSAGKATKVNVSKINFNDHSINGEKAKQAALSNALKIYGSSSLSQQTKDSAYQRMGLKNPTLDNAIRSSGIGTDQVDYMARASQSSTDKSNSFVDVAGKMTNDQLIQYIIPRRLVAANGKQLIDNTVLTALYNNGYLSKAQHTELSKIYLTQDKNGNFTPTTRTVASFGSSSSASSTKLQTLRKDIVKAAQGFKAPKSSSGASSKASLKAPKLSVSAAFLPKSGDSVKSLTPAQLDALFRIAKLPSSSGRTNITNFVRGISVRPRISSRAIPLARTHAQIMTRRQVNG